MAFLSFLRHHAILCLCVFVILGVQMRSHLRRQHRQTRYPSVLCNLCIVSFVDRVPLLSLTIRSSVGLHARDALLFLLQPFSFYHRCTVCLSESKINGFGDALPHFSFLGFKRQFYSFRFSLFGRRFVFVLF